jgi:hypothetical protein
MTLKYRLILLLAVLVGVLAAVTIQSAKAAPTTCIDSPKSELNQSSVSEYKTLLFVLNDVESNNTEHTIYKEINEYYIDWCKFYKRFYEQIGEKAISSKHKKN